MITKNGNNYEEAGIIQKKIITLDPSQRKIVVNQLSSAQRVLLFKIIKNHGKVGLSEYHFNDLKKKIDQALMLPINLTRTNGNNSILRSIECKIRQLVSRILYLFNHLTAFKAVILIETTIANQCLKDDKLPSITKNNLVKLIKNEQSKLESGEKVKLAKILEENGFSTRLIGLNFSKDFLFQAIDLEGVSFVLCKLDWSSCSTLCLENIRFQSCRIYNLSLAFATLKDCIFDNCEMREVMFTGADLKNVLFNTSSLISCSFEDASMIDCKIHYCSLPGTHFFEAVVNKSSITESCLRDTVFFETFELFEMDSFSKDTAVVTKPTTAILIDPELKGLSLPKAFMKLDQSSSTIPLRISMRLKVKKDEINIEVEEALTKISKENQNQTPIPQQLIKKLEQNPNSESAKILKKASKLASHIDSFYLPGANNDIPPALYGQKKDEKTICDDDYRRSILELGIIHQAFNKGVPLMAVCRGFQMVNIYFGAQLTQYLKGHDNTIPIQRFELINPQKMGIYSKAMKNKVMSVSFHHQAVLEKKFSPEKEYLESSVIYQGVVKASEMNKSGAVPMVLLQFHPEFFKAKTADTIIQEINNLFFNLTMSNENEEFWKILSDSSRAYRAKRTVLMELEDKRKEIFKRLTISIKELEDKRMEIFKRLISISEEKVN